MFPSFSRLAAAATLAGLAACSGPSDDPASATAAPSGEPASGHVLIENARVFDGERDLGEVTLVLRDGVIERIAEAGASDLPEDAERIDHRGRFIIPGLVNDHAHVGNTAGTEHGDRFYTRDHVVRDLRQFQAYGVTTVVALGMNGEGFFDIRDEVAGDPALGAQLFGAGAGIGAVDGAPPAAAMGLASDPVARPADADAARAAVRAQADAGVDFIKLWVDDLGGKAPQMRPEIYRAAIDEAHRHDLLVAAHIHDLAPAADLVDSGVDIIAHGVRDAPVGDDLVAAMQAAGTGYIATLQIDEANYIYAEQPDWLDTPFLRNALPDAVHAQWADAAWREAKLADPATRGFRDALATNLRNLGTLREAGLPIGFGTDAGALPHRVPGFAEHRELQLMQQAGYTPKQALTTATRDAARLLGFDDRGLLQPGKRADFVVLSADPLADILNTRGIEEVWQAGQRVSGPVADYRAE
ncbi:amidohydrolase family protein [Luteimonas sp. BDR2-5]|uniref:amidohydrolase family protein n=1 Tax=Proluteimonas luteida TaxID=2878685 RepID=UPI001E36B725|nr:amidohydrolase family protein [Luteimonas sp. BDR2-5]MCD9028655.1 amidohydrolase family protein [Luteimonas sp. BDR2-5]